MNPKKELLWSPWVSTPVSVDRAEPKRSQPIRQEVLIPGPEEL